MTSSLDFIIKMPCRSDCPDCGSACCSCDSKRARALERELCEARSVIYQLTRLLPRQEGLILYGEAPSSLKERVDYQLEEHKKHRQEEKKVAEKSKKSEMMRLKRAIAASDLGTKRRKLQQLEEELRDLDEVDSDDERFWDREKAAFTP